MSEKELTLDELTKVCGFFSEESIVNNHYNCKHPECEDGDIDPKTGKWVGACISFNCPIAYTIKDSDGFNGDTIMGVVQKEGEQEE